MTGIARFLIVLAVGYALVGDSEAEDFRITSICASGTLTWTNAPTGAVCRISTTDSLTSAWRSAAFTMTGTACTVGFDSGNAGFYRVNAWPASNIVHYPLIVDSNDGAGAYGPMEVYNAPFTNGGIYFNGHYQYGDPDPSWGWTPELAIDFNGFMISAEFLVTNSVGKVNPIFVGGKSYRWGGFYIQADGTVALKYNNDGESPSMITCSAGVWHSAVLIYTQTNQTFEIYLDGTLAAAEEAQIIHGNDAMVTVSDYSNGTTFDGYLRNLKVFNLQE